MITQINVDWFIGYFIDLRKNNEHLKFHYGSRLLKDRNFNILSSKTRNVFANLQNLKTSFVNKLELTGINPKFDSHFYQK